MQIIQIEAGPVATNGYLIIDEQTGSAAIIDTPLDSATFFMTQIAEKNLNVVAILMTHTHWDHTADCKKISDLTHAPVYVHNDDLYRLTDPMSHTLFPLPFTIEAVNEVIKVKSGDTINIGNLSFLVLHTPGHTEGGVCYLENNEGVIFTGDTLFKESIGRVDLPGGSYGQLLMSIKSELMPLPEGYKVFSGHGPSTTIGWEKQHNPFLNQN